MDPNTQVPLCPVPAETAGEVLPMLIVIGLFLAAGWLYRWWKRARTRRNPEKQKAAR